VVTELTVGLQKLAAQDLEYRIRAPFPDQYEELRNNYNQASAALAKAIGAARVGARRLLTTIAKSMPQPMIWPSGTPARPPRWRKPPPRCAR
jgi:methyl-accepting chemotaxis protein